jgi:pimeloyl-ACP methyl ester carboxylesterase
MVADDTNTCSHRGQDATLQGVRVEANGAELCVEAIGAESDPAVLLIMGSGASMDWWEDEFCSRLADGGRLVVRYDHRDTGESVSCPPGAPDYSGADLVADAAGILDALDIPSANVVGQSMGGALAQVLALDDPHRVSSLCLIATSPSGPDEDLPGMTAEGAERFAAIERPDWSDRAAVIEYLVEASRAVAGHSRPFDEPRYRALAARVADRTRCIESSMTNHELLDSPPRWRERLGDLDVPTLVIHGREDPFLPYPHGQALAREIPGARLVTLDRAGHELPREDWDVVIPAILEHTAG